jgi:glycosyltransferase involved in cell wall biosynthesis
MTNAVPLVSICCLTYNHEAYIRQCLDGMLIQKSVDFEVLIHDDASTDGTVGIIKEYQLKYPNRIKPIFQTQNQYSKGVKATFEFNLPRVKGSYIAFCEGDDYWTDPLKLQKQVNFLEQYPDYVLCGSRAEQVTFDGEQLEIEGRPGDHEIVDMARENLIPTCTALFRSKYAVNMPAWISKVPIGDWPMFLYMAQYGKIKVLEDITGAHRVHDQGIWTTHFKNGRQEKNYLMLLDLFGVIRNKFDQETNGVLHQQYLSQVCKLITHYNKSEDFKKAREYLQLLFQDLMPEQESAKQLENELIEKQICFKKRIEALEELNKKILDSKSYKLGNKFARFFNYLHLGHKSRN